MSISFMALAWKADIPSGRKLVLLSLCDHANNEGECFPSVEAIAHKCSMGQRTVQQHIGELESAGILVRRFRQGRSTLYRLDPCNFCRAAESAGAQDSALLLAAVGAPPPQLLHATPAVPAPITISEPSMKSSSNRQAAPGTALPSAWTLPQSWEQWAMQAQSAWSAAQVQFVANKFRDYWIAMPGQRGIKADWFAAWRNWCRNEKPAVQNSHAAQAMRWAGAVLTKAGHEAPSIKPAPGESQAMFAARVMQHQAQDCMTATSPTPDATIAHTDVPTRSPVSPANRAAALDAARALKSRPARRHAQAYGLCAEVRPEKPFGPDLPLPTLFTGEIK